jgi:cytochrome c peroxidase
MAFAITTGIKPAEANKPGSPADSDVREEAKAKGLGPLDEITVPEPPDLGEYVKDKELAIVLGKALFWDMQVGSDGQACASCHFQAGADNRVKNQLSPGLLRVNADRTAHPDTTFGSEYGTTASGQGAGPNYSLVAADFPFHQLEDSEDRNSEVIFDMNDAASSQGTFDGGFVSVSRARQKELVFSECGDADGRIFNVDGIAVRKVEPRNTPTMINAVFNHRNFWDGRANNIFNGLNPLGERGLQPTDDNPNPGTLVLDDSGNVSKIQLRIKNASLASQAVGPPLSDFEMSCAGRSFADLGRKLRTRNPLAFQEIDRNDSVLASWRNKKGPGLNTLYQNLIMQAFKDKFWAKPGDEQLFDANGEPVEAGPGYTQLEVNFSLFFGLAVQLYEATLISDRTRFDVFMKGDDGALTEVEKFGLEVFLNEGKCIACHVGPEFTGASVRLRANQPDGNEEPIERMIMGDGGTAVYDGGFYNIGVRPTFEDLGVGADLAGYPLSFSRQEVDGPEIDDFNFNTDKFEVSGRIVAGERVAVDGAFKVAGLRNVELTGPYFHNGGQATLLQVVEFYDRGGDRRDQGCGDTTGFAEECSNLDPDIEVLNLGKRTRKIGREKVSAEEALVQFLVALTDERVRWEMAPFDHPQLFVPNGHPGDQYEVTDDGTGRATDEFLEIPAVGSGGAAYPLDTFLGLHPLD